MSWCWYLHEGAGPLLKQPRGKQVGDAPLASTEEESTRRSDKATGVCVCVCPLSAIPTAADLSGSAASSQLGDSRKSLALMKVVVMMMMSALPQAKFEQVKLSREHQSQLLGS